MTAGQALIQADLDYQKADVNQKIQQYVGASQGPSAKLDKVFIMGIEIGLSILLSIYHSTKPLFPISGSGETNLHA